MTITYRDAAPGDAAALKRIFDTTFSDTFGHLYRAEDLDAFLDNVSLADWEKQLGDPGYAVWLAEAGGAPIGYVKLGPMKLPIETHRPAILLHQLYVVKDHQGVGIAQLLMDWAFTEAKRRGADDLYLTVFVDNQRARRFYGRFGFEPVGRYDFMVGSHADEDVILRKPL
jgi:GNAT superfamily N-acetyltransferase